MTIKILNLYAGIGGNRKLWNGDIEITSIELNPEIAKIYKDFFPNDEIIVTDAHKYLLEHYKEFDFIWSSPPCPTHSRLNTLLVNGKGLPARFPDMQLYEEIIFLQTFFKGKWVVENVRSYYNPLIKPQEDGRHYYWANFIIPNETKDVIVRNNKGFAALDVKMKLRNTQINNWYNYKGDKRTVLNNMVAFKAGLHIFECAFKTKQKELNELFNMED